MERGRLKLQDEIIYYRTRYQKRWAETGTPWRGEGTLLPLAGKACDAAMLLTAPPEHNRLESIVCETMG